MYQTPLSPTDQTTSTINALLADQSSQHPDRPALVAPGISDLTYRELHQQVRRTAEVLHGSGVGAGDRVGVVLPNGPEMATAFLSVASAATCAPLNPAYRESEFEFYLSDLNARALIVEAGTVSPAREAAAKLGIPLLELTAAGTAGIFTLQPMGAFSSREKQELRDPSSEDVALVLHTSGTTARPKIVPLTQANLCASAEHIRRTLELSPADRCLNVMPLFHIHGLVAALLASLSSGASVVCTPGFVATRFFEWLDEYRPTWYTAVPTMHQAIVSRADGMGDVLARCPLRFIRSSSAALPPQVLAELEQLFGAPVVEAYGMTEAAHQMACNPLPPQVRKPGSVGLPAGPEICILDEAGRELPPGEIGEVAIRGANVTPGYENNPAANETAFTDGWFRTGDRGFLDVDGYLVLTGRLKELINRGGEKISPREVDEALLDHPAVAQAVAFAMPDPRLGEEVAAAVVLRPDAAVAAADLRAFAAARLADFKVPRRILFLDEIPKGPTGKVQRIGMAERLGLLDSVDEPATPPKADTTPPGTALEAALAGIWCQVLGVPQVGVHARFFDLGGDSILGAQLVQRVQAALMAELSPLCLFEDGGTVAGMAARIEAARSGGQPTAAPTLASVQRTGEDPLSYGQARFWFLDQLDPGLSLYNRPAVMRLTGELNPAALNQALNQVVARHESLRTTFPSRDGEPVQQVAPSLTVPLPVQDVPLAEVDDHLTREIRRPFDLAEGPLLRAVLFVLGPREYRFLLVVHHIVFDGWSSEVFFRELGTAYTAALAGTQASFPPLPLQYADYARWQRSEPEQGKLQAGLAYWKRQLMGAPPFLELPGDRPRPALQRFQGAQHRFTLSPELTARLQSVGKEAGATLFMVLLAGFQVLLQRYTGVDDLVVGTPVAGRTRAETEGLIGFFVNTLALRTDLSGNPSFRELVGRVRETALGAYTHADVPFEKLVEELQPPRDRSRTPMIQVLFALQNTPAAALRLPGLGVAPVDVDAGTAKLDLMLVLEEQSAGLKGHLTYNTDLFEASTVARLEQDLQTLLEGAAADPACPAQRLAEGKVQPPAALAPTASTQTTAVRRQKPGTTSTPESTTARRLMDLWTEVLGSRPEDPGDSFFDLGGHSLAAVRLLARVEREWGTSPSVTAFFHRPTVEAMAAFLDGDLTALSSCLVPIQPHGHRAPFFCVHAVDGWVTYYQHLARYLGPDQPFYGLQAAGLDGTEPHHTRIEEMAAHYLQEIRTVQPRGPYSLGGLSGGGMIAYEMAQQLRQEGEEVVLLALLDTWRHGGPRRLPLLRRLGAHLRTHPQMLAQLPRSERLEYLRVRLRGLGIRVRMRGWLIRSSLEHAGVRAGGDRKQEVMAAQYVAFKRYTPQPYPGRITLFVAEEQPVGCYPEPDLGWTGLAVESEVHRVPGRHGGIVTEPHVQVLAEKLEACLQRTRPQTG